MEVAAHKTILAPGDMLGCYRIENFLGQGGFGVTYLALDTKLDLQVAIKEYMPEQIAERTHDNSVQPRSPDEQTTFAWGLSRFIKEARTLAKFKHANIVRVMAVFEQNGTAYMVMEYERGQDLKGVLARSGKQTEPNLKNIIFPVLDGLAQVHKHGYIHRDIKPANILIRHDGSPVLLDFGSARLATGAQTQALTALVSVGYAPLEQYNESNDVQQGPWTDIYALGAVLYFAITGNPPVDSTLRGSAVLNDRPDPLMALEKIAPEGFTLTFCQAIDWALSFKVKDRPQTLEDWRARLMSDDETVLMPRLYTQPVRGHDDALIPHGTQELAGGATSTPREATTSRRRRLRDPDDMDELASFAAPDLKATAVVPPPAHAELDWETRSERLQRQGFTDVVSDASQTSKPTASRALVVCALTAILLLVPAITLKQHWLPLLQGKTTVDAASSPIVDNAITDLTTPETTDRSATDSPTSTDAAAAADKAREEARLAAATRARQAAAEASKRREQQAAKEALQQELDAAEKTAELARRQQADKIKADEREALLQAQRAAEAAAERARQQETRKIETEEREAVLAAQLAAEKAAIVRQQEQEKQAELDTLALLEVEPQLAEPAIDPTQQISDTDISSVLRRFNALRSAITSRNGEEMRKLTYESARKYAYFDYLFSSFDTIEISLGNIQASRLDQTVRAELRVTRMQRANGDIAFPPTEFQTIPIHSVRTTEWSNVHW